MWYQSLAGAEVNLSKSARHRIGVDGFGVDDVGVLEQAEAFASLLRFGEEMNALSADDIDAFLSASHGSREQVEVGQRLGVSTLNGLRDAVEAIVQKRIVGIPGSGTDSFNKFCGWAADTGWEFPVVYADNERGVPMLALTEATGLSVIECSVAEIEGPIGDVICALIEILSEEARKQSGFDAICFRLEMYGLPVKRLKPCEAKRIGPMDGKAICAWIKEQDPEGLEDLYGYFGEDEPVECVAEQYRDILVCYSQMTDRVGRVFGSKTPKSTRAKLKRIRDSAKRCEDSELKTFVLRACRCLVGDNVNTLFDRIPTDTRFERMPGDFAFVDTGWPIAHLEDAYHELNEVSWNGEDFGVLPLKGEVDDVVELLARITISERLLIALSALLESDDVVDSSD